MHPRYFINPVPFALGVPTSVSYLPSAREYREPEGHRNTSSLLRNQIELLLGAPNIPFQAYQHQAPVTISNHQPQPPQHLLTKICLNSGLRKESSSSDVTQISFNQDQSFNSQIHQPPTSPVPILHAPLLNSPLIIMNQIKIRSSLPPFIPHLKLRSTSRLSQCTPLLPPPEHLFLIWPRLIIQVPKLPAYNRLTSPYLTLSIPANKIPSKSIASPKPNTTTPTQQSTPEQETTKHHHHKRRPTTRANPSSSLALTGAWARPSPSRTPKAERIASPSGRGAEMLPGRWLP